MTLYWWLGVGRDARDLEEFHKYFAQQTVCTVQTSLGSHLIGFYKVNEVSGIVSSPVFHGHNLQTCNEVTCCSLLMYVYNLLQ